METQAQWIGEQPGPLQIGAVLWVGVTGILIAGLQPLLLGTLAQEGRISSVQLGHAATAEMLLMGAACAFAGLRWRAERLRTIGAIAALLYAALNIWTLRTSGDMVTLVRSLAGIPGGVMVWIAVAMITRSPTPERWSGIYLTVQTLAQFLLAASLAAWVVPNSGANGGFLALAILSAIAAVAALALPNRFAPLATGIAGSDMPSARGFIALCAVFLYLACVIGVFIYTEPLSRQAGHEQSVVGIAVSASLACQVLGGATATLLAGRLRWFPALLACAALIVGCLLAFASLPGPALFVLASAVFGFVWLFSLPFLVPMVIEADPTRRAAVLVGGAELLGASLGPLFASFVVTDADARGVLVFGAGALVLGVGIALTLHRQRAQATDTLVDT
jgi:hypothetical protein